jgi:hypothetical protein
MGDSVCDALCANIPSECDNPYGPGVSGDTGGTGRNLRLLITGGPNCGKTSLAFRLAYDIAAAGGTPWFICNQTKLEAQLPLSVQITGRRGGEAELGLGAGAGGWDQDLDAPTERMSGMASMSADVLCRLQMKYVTSVRDLKACLAGLHACEPRPSAVIVDDFSTLVDPLHSVSKSDANFLEICLSLGSFLDDALNFLNTHTTQPPSTSTSTSAPAPLSAPLPLQVVLTDSCSDPAYLQIMRQSCRLIHTNIQPQTQSAPPSFSLQLVSGAKGQPLSVSAVGSSSSTGGGGGAAGSALLHRLLLLPPASAAQRGTILVEV